MQTDFNPDRFREGHPFPEDLFWPQFRKDLLSANSRVIVLSPFIAILRLKLFLPQLANLIHRNIPVCVFLQQPNYDELELTRDDWIKKEDMKEAIRRLQGLGAHVSFKKDVHMKVVVIDKHIVWDGSLNIMSHNNTKERMRRFLKPIEIEEAIRDCGLNDCPQCRLISNELGTPQLSTQFRNIRTVLGRSRRDLTVSNRLPLSTISRLEDGEDIRISSLVKACDAAECSVLLVPNWLLPIFRCILAKARLKKVETVVPETIPPSVGAPIAMEAFLGGTSLVKETQKVDPNRSRDQHRDLIPDTRSQFT